MDYAAPDAADFRDVRALNLAYLALLKLHEEQRSALPPGLRALALDLDATAARRLSDAPFLLFSLHEGATASRAWPAAERRTGDLFAAPEPASGREHRLVAATVAVLWRLSRDNLHTARVVSGAPANWCEALAARPLIELLDNVAFERGLLRPRWPHETTFWERLLVAGSCADATVRSAAQRASLQAVLTRSAADGETRLAAAACRIAPVATRRQGDP